MLNKVILMGRLTADPVMSQSVNGNISAWFHLAIDSGWGENKRTDFIECRGWNKTADFIKKYFSKGQMMIVSDGCVTTANWEDDEGNKHYKTYILARSVAFGASKKEQNGSGNEADEAFAPLLDEDNDLPF